MRSVNTEDTLALDTTRAGSELDTVVNYSAKKVDFTFNPRITTLTGKAKVSYKAMILTAHRIDVHWNEDLIYAWGKLDTLSLDSSEGGGDTLVWKDLPRMKDGRDITDGKTMVYHMKTRKGKVSEGVTEYDDGICHGTTIKKVGDNVLNIRSGYYTTCDHEEPHYHFWARDLKLIVKKKIVARPVVLYFGPVPVAIIPFAVFPASGGRHSGLIVPTYGESAAQGRYFRDLGYYWVPNDYFDATGMLDFYEKFGIQFTADTRYVLRYRFSGNLAGSLVNKRYEDRVENRWHVRTSHKHTLSPSMTLNIHGEFQSDASYQKDISENAYDRMKQFIKSDATLSKRWPGTPYSGSVNVNHHEVLTSGEVSQWLPQVRFSRSKSPVFPQPEDAKPEDARWYNQLYYSYSGDGKMRRSVKVDKFTRYEDVPDDTIRIKIVEYSKHPWRYKSGVKHDMNFSASQKPFTYFSLTENIGYTEAWFDEWLSYHQNPDTTVESTKHEEFRARRTYSSSISLGTSLYGLFNPGLFGIEALRHKLDPGLSFTYRPDFSEPRFGYYQKFRDTSGKEQFYDRFDGNLYGATPRTESRSLRINVGNLFQYKRMKDDKEIKGDLFDLHLSTAHNFAADSLKWSNLSSLFKFSPRIGTEKKGGISSMFTGFSVNLRGNHSFYALKTDPDSESKIEVNQPAPDFLRLVNFDLSLSFNLRSSRGAAFRDTASFRRDFESMESGPGKQLEIEREEEPEEEEPGWKPIPIPWDASISFHYSENHRNPDNITKNITSGLNLSVDVTPNWSVGYNTHFDLDRKCVTLSGFNIRRDMHCWVGILNWTPVGSGRGYYVRIAIKSPQLQDVKVEKRKGRTGIIGM